MNKRQSASNRKPVNNTNHREKSKKLSPEQIEKRKRMARKKRLLEIREKKKQQRKRKKILNIIFSSIYYGLMLVIAVSCIIFFLSHSFRVVSGESMEPTLHSGDRLVIAKPEKVERFSLITFDAHESNKEYVKRVIGLPGDGLMIGTNTVSIIPGNDPSLGEYIFQIDETVTDDLTGLREIPEDQYFVIGDNLANSRDSRTIGLIHKEDIDGIASFRFYPLKNFGPVH